MRTKKEINGNFKIKVNGRNFKGRYESKLVGVKGLVSLIGEELSEKLIEKAFQKREQVTVCKLRRGLIIRFYSY